MKHAIQHTLFDNPKETGEKACLRILDPLLQGESAESVDSPRETAKTLGFAGRSTSSDSSTDSPTLPYAPLRSPNFDPQFSTPRTEDYNRLSARQRKRGAS